MRRVRWTCPTAAHAAVLGPTRPRLDDACRYCLGCTDLSGRLTKRVALALEAEREAKAERSKQKLVLRRAREAAKETKRFVVDGVDLREALRVAWSCPIVLEWSRARFAPRGYGPSSHSQARMELPRIYVRWQKRIGGRLGFAIFHEMRICVTPKMRAETAVATVLHEAAHLIVGLKHSHDSTFWACLRTLREEYLVVARAFPALAGRLAPEEEKDVDGSKVAASGIA